MASSGCTLETCPYKRSSTYSDLQQPSRYNNILDLQQAPSDLFCPSIDFGCSNDKDALNVLVVNTLHLPPRLHHKLTIAQKKSPVDESPVFESNLPSICLYLRPPVKRTESLHTPLSPTPHPNIPLSPLPYPCQLHYKPKRVIEIEKKGILCLWHKIHH